MYLHVCCSFCSPLCFCIIVRAGLLPAKSCPVGGNIDCDYTVVNAKQSHCILGSTLETYFCCPCQTEKHQQSSHSFGVGTVVFSKRVLLGCIRPDSIVKSLDSASCRNHFFTCVLLLSVIWKTRCFLFSFCLSCFVKAVLKYISALHCYTSTC